MSLNEPRLESDHVIFRTADDWKVPAAPFDGTRVTFFHLTNLETETGNTKCINALEVGGNCTRV